MARTHAGGRDDGGGIGRGFARPDAGHGGGRLRLRPACLLHRAPRRRQPPLRGAAAAIRPRAAPRGRSADGPPPVRTLPRHRGRGHRRGAGLLLRGLPPALHGERVLLREVRRPGGVGRLGGRRLRGSLPRDGGRSDGHRGGPRVGGGHPQDHATRDHAQRRVARLRARWQVVHRHGRRRQRERHDGRRVVPALSHAGHRQRAGPDRQHPGQGAADRCRRARRRAGHARRRRLSRGCKPPLRHSARQSLRGDREHAGSVGERPSEPVAGEFRPRDGRLLGGRRGAGRSRGDQPQRRQCSGTQLRMAVHGGHALHRA